MAVLTWLHLSDWHQRGNEFDRKEVRDKLLDDIERCRGRFPALQRVDIVFFTGDLAFSGKPEEFDTAAQQLLDPVLKKVDRKPEHLFVIPGNHDLDRDILTSMIPDVRKSPTDRKQFQELIKEGNARMFAEFPFAAFKIWFGKYGAKGGGGFGSAEVVTVGGAKIGVLGCNSALMCGRNLDRDDKIDDEAKLAVGMEQIHDGLRMIREADLRIGLIHHPFNWLRDYERYDIEQEMMKVCHFILRGHEHNTQINIVPGTAGQGVIVQGGACYDGKHPVRPRYANAYNFVNYDTETHGFDVYCRKWDDDTNEWNDDHNNGADGVYKFSAPHNALKKGSRGKGSVGLSGKPRNPRQHDLPTIRQTYLNYVCRRWENLEMRGISRTSKTEAVRLDEVYVSLAAERETVQHRIPADRITDDPAMEDIEAEQNRQRGSENYLPVGPSKFGMTGERRTERIGLAEALRENRSLVVLGDPGAGKTTLARFLARRFALAYLEGSERVLVPVQALPAPQNPTPQVLHTEDYGEARLPLLLRVADFAEALRENRNLRLRDFLKHARGEAEISDTETAALFEEALTQGRALVILDGLDEVAQTADRGRIARRINDFVNGIDARNRMLVTSRIAGYPAAKLDGPFFPVTMRDMEFAQIQRFVTSRVIAYSRDQTPGAGAQELLRRVHGRLRRSWMRCSAMRG